MMKFTYTGIGVKDIEKSIKFYTEGLGMELLGRDRIGETGGEVAALKNKNSEQVLELNWYPDSNYREGSELDHLGFEVDDVKAETPRLIALGAERARDPETRASSIVGFVKDPNGIWLELFQATK